MEQEEKYYDMKHHSLGHCFIYYCEKFTDRSNKHVPETIDCSPDPSKIRNLFAEIGYKSPSVIKDPSKDQILKDLKAFAEKQEDHRQQNSLVFYILTHGGNHNQLVTSDGKTIGLEELINLVDVPSLAGKPKIFVIQACRGENTERGQTADDQHTADHFEDILSPITTKPDFLIIFPTAPNYVSWIFRKYGSWFTELLTTGIRKYRNESKITDILQRLIFSVNCLPIVDERKSTWYMQVPYYTSTLTKALVLSQNDLQSKICTKLQLNYREADCIRSKIQVILQEAAASKTNMFTDELNHIQFTDYSYLMDESTGCYDVSGNRKCFVINAVLEGGNNLQVAKQDMEEIQQTMSSMDFETEIKSGDKDRDILTILKEDVSNMNKDVSCLFCFVLTGSQSFEGNRRWLNNVVGTFKNAKSLLNKPKVFILQAYRSTTAAPVTLSKYATDPLIPLMRYSVEADVLIIQAHSRDKGDNLCKMLCTSFKKYGETVPIIDLLISYIPNEHGDTWTDLEPTFTSSLKRHLVLQTSFKKDMLTEDSQQKDHVKRLTKIMEKLTKVIAVNNESQSSATTYEDILTEADKKLKEIKLYREDLAGNYRVVVAIDFGTTFSGFAWSMRSHLENYELKQDDKTNMPLIRTNVTGNVHKTSTCLLLDSEKNVISFGSKAEQDYKKLVNDGIHQPYYFFKHFKSGFNEETGDTSYIKEMGGKKLPAEEVFSKALNKLVKSVMKMFERDTNLKGIDTKYIKWIITVPALWSEKSKKIIRTCAESTNIPDYSLSIALESECAAIYCQHLIPKCSVTTEESNDQPSKEGEKIMVVDLGGETVDLAVHEILKGNKLKEMHRSTHMKCGGTSVNTAFLNVIKEIFVTSDDDEESALAMIKTDHPKEYLDLIQHFEELKKYSQNQTDVRIPLPINILKSLYQDKSIDQVVEESIHGTSVSIKKNDLVLSSRLFKGIFQRAIEKIVSILKAKLNEEPIRDVKHIFLVGGFANSQILQDAITSEFSKERVIHVPIDCDLIVLKGAVIYGHTPSYIEERLIPYTYGVACGEKIEVLIKKNTIITEHEECKTEPSPKSLEREIYMSTVTNPDYIRSCRLVGKLLIHVTKPSDHSQCFDIFISFGGTELKAYAKDRKTKTWFCTTIEMLAGRTITAVTGEGGTI